jgi:hypothetical protein
MTDVPEKVVLEVGAPDGGSYVLSRVPPSDTYRAHATPHYLLSLHPNARGQRWRAGRIGVIVGIVAPMILLGVAVLILLPPDHHGGDFLMPTRRDALLVWACSLCILPVTAVLGYFLGAARARLPSYDVAIHETVVVNGDDRGQLLRVESDAASSHVVLVLASGEERIPVAGPQDAVLLVDALSGAVPSEPS